MRAVPFTLMLLVCGAASAATVYKWVDDQGVVHFSDQPHPGATKVHVGEPQGYTPPAQPTSRVASESPTPPATGSGTSCRIESPGDQEMLMNAHSVSGHVSVTPGLTPEERVVITLDGKIIDNAADAGGGFTISPIDRGEHSIAAQVLGPGGQVICQTGSVTFFVHQPSSQAPIPSVRPKF